MWQEMHWHDVSESYSQRNQALRAEAEGRSARLNAAGDRHTAPAQAIRVWLASLHAARRAPARPIITQPCPSETKSADYAAAI